MRLRTIGLTLLAILCAVPALAQNTTQERYDYCHNLAARESGWSGDTRNPQSRAVAQGAGVGAGAGALIGGLTGGSGWTGAAIGAAFGAVAGEARRSRGARNVQDQQNMYYNILNACLEGR
jgi:hypothetical protein